MREWRLPTASGRPSGLEPAGGPEAAQHLLWAAPHPDPVVTRGEPSSPLEAEEAELLVGQQPTCSLLGPPLLMG